MITRMQLESLDGNLLGSTVQLWLRCILPGEDLTNEWCGLCSDQCIRVDTLSELEQLVHLVLSGWIVRVSWLLGNHDLLGLDGRISRLVVCREFRKVENGVVMLVQSQWIHESTLRVLR